MVENAVNEIKDVFGKVGADIVAIYPYAHLSSSLSSPDAAKKILSDMEAGLGGNGSERQEGSLWMVQII